MWMAGLEVPWLFQFTSSGRPMTSDTSEYLCQGYHWVLEPADLIGRMYVVPMSTSVRFPLLFHRLFSKSLCIVAWCTIIAQKIAELGASPGNWRIMVKLLLVTLDNIAVNEAVTIPVLRPLIGSDSKKSRSSRAQDINTFDIQRRRLLIAAILFMPRRPETHGMREVLEAWIPSDHEAMIDDLMQHIEYIDFSQCPSYKPPKSFLLPVIRTCSLQSLLPPGISSLLKTSFERFDERESVPCKGGFFMSIW